MKKKGNTKRKEKLTVLVLCDERGDVQSVAIPDPKLADGINVETDIGTVQRLDVDGSKITPEILMGVRGDEAQKKAYNIISKMIRR